MQVDYAELARAEQAARTEFPQATNVVARLHEGRPYCEVWTNDHARTWTPTAHQLMPANADGES